MAQFYIMPRRKQYPVRVCPLANEEHADSKRQYAHTFHVPGQICVASALFELPQTNQLGILLHECGHILAGQRAGENAANKAAETYSGVPIYYKNGRGGPELEWINPRHIGKVRRALGI